MVSLRRRKLLGLCSGRSSFLTPLPRFFGNGTTPANSTPNTRSISVHPVNSDEIKPLDGNMNVRRRPGSSIVSDSSLDDSVREQQNERVSGPPIKRRKQHRRKKFQNQEPCLMRGVYYKNMKWQAAIKVDKKQIHLGTVGSQEEAARLYDRAAFMCGRELNFELSEAEKQELKKFNWKEFLAITRHAIIHKSNVRFPGPIIIYEKKGNWSIFFRILCLRSLNGLLLLNVTEHKRRVETESQRSFEPFPLQNDDSDNKNEDNGLSVSEDVEPDISVS